MSDDVVAVMDDLFFQSRVRAAARAAGRSVRFVTRLEDLDRDSFARLALVDLDAHVDVEEAIRRLAALPTDVVAFGPHVDSAGRQMARRAGARRVLAKSRFVSELPRLMGTEALGTPAALEGTR